MTEQSETIRQAKALPKDKRKETLMSFKETELHGHLKELFLRMQPDYTTEITHQAGELGKDLVIVKRDKIGIDVLGVVVKTGNIRGTTLGEVDEIKTRVKNTFSHGTQRKMEEIISQVEQAFHNPAEMKTIFSKLRVSKVVVVLAGEMSRSARQRLDAEVQGLVEIKDINWLIESFTEYYPEVFFEGRVMDFIQKKIQELEAKHWLSSKRKINLSDYFVEPPVATIDIPVTFDEGSLALIVEKGRIPFLGLKSILTPNRRIILVGDVGVGKSGALAKLTIDMLRQVSGVIFRGAPRKQKIKIPILVSSKEILEVDSSKTLLREYVGASEIADRFEARVLMIDALDEVPPDQGRKVIEKGERFSRELGSSLIITSRKIDIIKTSPTGFEKRELLPFEYGQALKLFEKLASGEQIFSSLRNGLDRIKFQIPMVPLSLLLLLDLAEEGKEIPASVTELYDRFYDLMLGRWDKDKGIEVLFDYFIKRSFLAELAFTEFLKKTRLEISQEEFQDFFNRYAERYSWDEEDMKGFTKEIERAGIISIKEKVTFQHRSFLDYFAARYIYDKRADFENLNDFIVEIYFDDIWSDVAFFYIGLLREVNEIILNKIFTNGEKGLSRCVDKLLTGRLLQAGWHSPTEIRYYGIEKAVTLTPVIREEFLKAAEKSKVKVPLIFADFLVMSLSDFAFGSAFLFKEAKSLLSDLLSRQLSKDSLYLILSLLSAIQRFLSPKDLRETSNGIMEIASKSAVLDTKEQARLLLLLLLIIQRRDVASVKTIKRKLDRLMKKHRQLFRELLPPRRKGFRPK